MSFIGDNIKSVRENRRMTQDELAENSGVHRVTLAKYESGKSIPGADVLGRMAKALNVTADTLLSDGCAQQEYGYVINDFTPSESELLTLYRDLNDKGQDALLRQARYLASDPDMKRGSASNTATA